MRLPRPALRSLLAGLALLAVSAGCSSGSGGDGGSDPSADPEVMRRGQAAYLKACVSCHQADGQGLAGAFPPLAGSEWAAAPDATIPARIVLHGLEGEIQVRGAMWRNVMLAQGGILSDQEVADVLTYVRASWGNRASPVSAEAIRQLRHQHASRDRPWTASELPSP